MTPVATGKTVLVNSAIAIIGPTGAGKTSLIGTAAEDLYDRTKQVMLLYSTSGGGFPTKVQSLIRLGIIWLWRMRTRGEAFETTIQASKGYWPAAINPSTGETSPGVALVPPITERYTMRCPNGHVVKVVPFHRLLTPGLCPTCQTHTTQQNMQVTKEQHRTKGFERVGGVAFDDLTSMQGWQMADMAARHARQEIKGEESALGGRIQSGELLLGGNNRSHYGFVQGRADEMVHNSLGIPGLSYPPIFTALPLETMDEGGLSVFGMKLAGKAKTDEAGSWFGNCLELAIVKDDDGQHVRRLCLNEFIDEQGRRHLIKHRGSPAMPPYLQDPAGQPWSQVNLGVFFALLEKDVQDNAAATEARFSDAPGLPEGEVVFGEPRTVEAGQAASGGALTHAQASPKVGAPRPKAVAPKPRTMPAAPAADSVTVTVGLVPITFSPVKEEEPPLPLEEPATPAEVPVPAAASTSVAAHPPAVSQASPAVSVGVARMAPPPGPRPPAPAPRRPPARGVPAPVPIVAGAGSPSTST